MAATASGACARGWVRRRDRDPTSDQIRVVFEFAVEHLAGKLDHDYSEVVPLAQLERALAMRFALLVREPAPYLARELGRQDLTKPSGLRSPRGSSGRSACGSSTSGLR
jgi:hypothetical protein